MMKNSPCYQCKNRKLYCHSQCNKYKTYRKKFSDFKDEKEFKDYSADAVYRMRGEGRCW